MVVVVAMLVLMTPHTYFYFLISGSFHPSNLGSASLEAYVEHFAPSQAALVATMSLDYYTPQVMTLLDVIYHAYFPHDILGVIGSFLDKRDILLPTKPPLLGSVQRVRMAVPMRFSHTTPLGYPRRPRPSLVAYSESDIESPYCGPHAVGIPDVDHLEEDASQAQTHISDVSQVPTTVSVVSFTPSDNGANH
eukprot:NODE_8223_length_716_cov_6.301855_g7969_i0.p1 GENE.NODE_8223_length_716_cov_6.301855_g7969_i0~~NODE_8223_length_716_cov_6.301855_g7969_i0.p1  ORF type:complete len:192 (-),score=25.00 NODE_8223_length_716_cov_6.301855_g7969_i0:139-714(-)